MLFETGHPWITFKDPCNLRSPQGHVGVVHSSNLCTEITLNTSDDEVAVCNLGSVNLLAHVSDGRPRSRAAEAHRDNRDADARQRHRHQFLHHPGSAPLEPAAPPGRPRPDGLPGCAAGAAASPYGVGCGGGLRRRRAWRRSRSTRSRPRSISPPSAAAIRRSRARCGAQGILPIDSIELLAEARGGVEMDRTTTLDWDAPARARASPPACATPTRWRLRRRRRSPTSAAWRSRSSPPTRTSMSNRTCRATSRW